MTDQEIFDKVALHLLTQGRQSRQTRHGETCRYRGMDGCQCAIGCLIEDDQYTPAMEGRGVRGLVEQYSHCLQDILDGTNTRLEFLSHLQSTHDLCLTRHDGTFDKADLLRRLRNVAEHYRLSAATLGTQP